MRLTPQEKAAGVTFRDAAQAMLTQSFVDDPPTYSVPNFLGLFRHACPARVGRSTALELREVRALSPGYLVNQDSTGAYVAHQHPDPPSEPSADGTFTPVPSGRFAFVWKTGRCRSCGQTAKSKAGRLTEGDRPPMYGRVSRS